ncbi:hypothetical protein ABXT70_09850 [Candidatus Njordibacter sp. Uisw_039]|uniref:hypothetical protein n=1 Tax=Candidatus Njordibacter sp. Uisw_039 TaxID=3230972 RepID=UPI003D5C3BD6
MKRATVLLSGAGTLGSRHLQGLARCAIPLDIHVYDIYPDALRISQARWEEVTNLKADHHVFLHNTCEALPVNVDIAVIATTANVRHENIAEIVSKCSVKYWILEKVLACSEENLDQILTSISELKNAWVNTPRRSLPWHSEIKALLGKGYAMTMKVDGGAWGLACNAIHFLDMFAWWTGETLVEIETNGLDSNWIEAKRAGNMEVMGTLHARFSGGSTVQLTAQPGDVYYEFELNDGSFIWHIDEVGGTCFRSDGLSIPGRIPYQSEVTGELIESLLSKGVCHLPGLETSAQMHRVYLHALLKHWQHNVSSSAKIVPIT